MRYVQLIIACSFFISVCYGQDIRLNVVSFNPCNKVYETDLLVVLSKDKKRFQVSDTLGTIYLDDPGVYKLSPFSSDLYRLTDSVKLLYIHPGQNYDTLTRATILDCVGPERGPDCGYVCCDKLCEGYNVDYYDNGQKRLEGKFKKGFPLGALTFYFPDGRKREIHYYDKEGKGRLIRKKITGN